MEFREKALSNWGRLSAKYPGRILAFALLGIFSVSLIATNLTMSTRWSDLLPRNDPLVKEFEKIVEEFTGAANSILVVSGPESEIKAFADEIVPEIEAIDEFVKRVDYKYDEDFLGKHGFMLTKANDLKKMAKIFEDLSLVSFLSHINDNFEETYIGDEESLSDKEKENNAIRNLDGLEYWIETMALYVKSADMVSDQRPDSAAGRFLIGDPYFISPDKRLLLIFIEPTFELTDTDPVVKSTDLIQGVIDGFIIKYPGITAGLTGTIPLGRDEMYYATRDLGTSSIVALVLILILFIFSFRMIAAPVLAALNLVLSVMFASGIIAIFVEELNMMTSMFAVILLGLGIDFSIHIISLYTERRAVGDDVSKAMIHTLSRSGTGIITGAITTAMAFLTLTLSDTRGIKELGFVLGLGIISVMITTIIILPSLLILREKTRRYSYRILNKKLEDKPAAKPLHFEFLGKLGSRFAKKPKTTLSLALLVTLLLLWSALNIEYDYNYLNMEPKGIPSVTLQDTLENAFDMSPDFAMVTVTSVEEARSITENAKKMPSVSMVESISDFVPRHEEQAKRVPYIKQIRDYLVHSRKSKKFSSGNLQGLISELERLDMNIYELGQMAFLGGQEQVERKCARIIGAPDDESSKGKIIELVEAINNSTSQAAAGLNLFQELYVPVLRKKTLAMADTGEITLDNLPESILSRFVNEKGDHFLITITPKEQVWNFEFLKRFTGQMKRISEKITGTPHLFLRLMELFARDGARAVVLTIITILLLLWLDFNSLKRALIAMVPLISGTIWMVGIMNLVGLPLTFVNMMGIPMIIGIGIDDGVHILHRYRIEGKDNARIVLRSTGRAVLLTSLTTMAGFGSLMIAKYQGFFSLGSLLTLGVAACFLTSVIFLPALISLFHKGSGPGAIPD